jgi:pyruvate,water dikinase
MSKALNLHALRAAGFPVPPFVVVPTTVFEAFLQTLATPPTASSLLEAALPTSLAEEILKRARELPPGAQAVRSSMAGEDSAHHSFAGQLDSFLDVRGHEALLSAVKAVWASAYGERAMAYRQQHGLRTDAIQMEVIIQVMVPAEVSGVIFTADPVARDPRWMVISAAEGLGEALVQGQVAGDTYRVQAETGEIEGQGGVLSPAQINRLANAARRIAQHFGSPQDIEFALADGQLFILQARPITTPIYTERLLWDNANIAESYSGVTTPLTFSVIRGAYAQVYQQFLALMGVERVDENVLRNLLGFYNGQVYYQLLNWYTALSWLPAFEQNRRFMEQMMGVKQSAGAATPQRMGDWLALGRWLVRMLALHRSHERRVRDFLNHFNAVLAGYQARDFTTFTPHQLRAAYQDLEKRVLGEWRAPILTDFFAMIFSGVLRRLCERWFPNEKMIHNDLLAGEGGIESLEPARRVQALAGQVRADSRLQAAFAFSDPAQTLGELRARPDFAAFNAALDDYLRVYGDRCMNELKLEEPNLRDDPARLVRLVASAVNHPSALTGGAAVREQAEARLTQLPPGQRWLLTWIVNHTRRHVRNRENMRFARTRLFGLLRGLCNALGRQWAKAGTLERPDDIYYLTIGEIWDFVEGAAVTQNLRGLVALRRAEYVIHAQRPLPDRFETFGVPYHDTPRDLLAKMRASTGGDLRGLGCCSGRVRARARVVRGADEASDLDNAILVAERTDPGWVFLFPSAAGILVERGSALSHSVIVAREMGKPIIVNIPSLTARIHTGDEVEMNGSTGEVWVHRSISESPTR